MAEKYYQKTILLLKENSDAGDSEATPKLIESNIAYLLSKGEEEIPSALSFLTKMIQAKTIRTTDFRPSDDRDGSNIENIISENERYMNEKKILMEKLAKEIKIGELCHNLFRKMQEPAKAKESAPTEAASTAVTPLSSPAAPLATARPEPSAPSGTPASAPPTTSPTRPDNLATAAPAGTFGGVKRKASPALEETTISVSTATTSTSITPTVKTTAPAGIASGDNIEVNPDKHIDPIKNAAKRMKT